MLRAVFSRADLRDLDVFLKTSVKSFCFSYASVQTPPIATSAGRVEVPVGAGCVSTLRRSRRREMKICGANRRPRWPRKVTEGGDPERSVGPDVGSQRFSSILPRQIYGHPLFCNTDHWMKWVARLNLSGVWGRLPRHDECSHLVILIKGAASKAILSSRIIARPLGRLLHLLFSYRKT